MAGSSPLEELLDCPAFQRLDYAAACKAIGIRDLEAPRFPRMMPATTLKSWQVTGIYTPHSRDIPTSSPALSTYIGERGKGYGYERRLPPFLTITHFPLHPVFSSSHCVFSSPPPLPTTNLSRHQKSLPVQNRAPACLVHLIRPSLVTRGFPVYKLSITICLFKLVEPLFGPFIFQIIPFIRCW